MGSVIESYRFFGGRKLKLYFGIFLVYFIAGFAFLAIGLQPVKSAESVYASEAELAEESLQIPAISLDAPVKISTLTGTDLSVPEQIAGSFTMNKNKTFLFGHASTIFKDLKNLHLSDEVVYNEKHYRITDIVEKPKAEIDMANLLKEEQTDTIVLMTCSGEKIEGTNGDHTHRLILTAKITTNGDNDA